MYSQKNINFSTRAYDLLRIFDGGFCRVKAAYPGRLPPLSPTLKHHHPTLLPRRTLSIYYMSAFNAIAALSKRNKGTPAAPPRPKTANLGFRTTTGAREGLSGPAPSPVARAIYWRNPRRTEQNISCVTGASSGTPPHARLRETCCARSVVRPLRPSVSCVSAPSRTCPLWVQLRG